MGGRQILHYNVPRMAWPVSHDAISKMDKGLCPRCGAECSWGGSSAERSGQGSCG
jgi:hypothetical protein